MTVNYIKQKMNDGHAVLGPFLKMNDPALIEQAALAGFDFCIIDMDFFQKQNCRTRSC